MQVNLAAFQEKSTKNFSLGRFLVSRGNSSNTFCLKAEHYEHSRKLRKVSDPVLPVRVLNLIITLAMIIYAILIETQDRF